MTEFLINVDDSDDNNPIKKQRKSYINEKKLEFLKFFKSEGERKIYKTAKHFGVSDNVIRYALRQEKQLTEQRDDWSKNTRIRRIARERKPKYPEVDQKVLD
jgi:Zn-dependent peptidase ImmA (M78 family)